MNCLNNTFCAWVVVASFAVAPVRAENSTTSVPAQPDFVQQLLNGADFDPRLGHCLGDTRLARGFTCGVRDNALVVIRDKIADTIAVFKPLPVERPTGPRGLRDYRLLRTYRHELPRLYANIVRVLGSHAPLVPSKRPHARDLRRAAELARLVQHDSITLWYRLNHLHYASRGDDSALATALFASGSQPDDTRTRMIEDARNAAEILMFQYGRSFNGLVGGRSDLFSEWSLHPQRIPSVVTCAPLPSSGATPLTDANGQIVVMRAAFAPEHEAVVQQAARDASDRIRACVSSVGPARGLEVHMSRDQAHVFDLAPATLFAYGARPQPSVRSILNAPRPMFTDIGRAKRVP